MQDRHFTDEELVAYLDGEADHAPVALIDAALERDPVLRQRVRALGLDTLALRAGYETLLNPAPASIPAMQTTGNGWLRSTSVAAGIALAAGIAIGVLIPGGKDDGWTEYVAAYQALYSSSTLSHISPVPSDQQRELARVGAAIGKPIDLARLTAFPDAEYKRAQVLSFDGRALVQLAFLTSTGEPLALCIIRSDNVPAGQPDTREMEGMHAAKWSDGTYEYLLIGGSDDALIRRMSSGFADTGV
ncbi:hypothetical protein [uncultured Roseobacter sp.]|uniref:anti-sigma factor family protein n=1 Tax=uncultured Roseobacter sp. TaxID=114847 RepID=UPI00262B021C|nr:hypothetical protein [uncultured Roseobacter sp.]